MIKLLQLLRNFLLPTVLATSSTLSWAEDIDLFVGSNSSGKPNILFVLDNSANWSSNNQKWPDVNTGRTTAFSCGNDCTKQGVAELGALYDVISGLAPNSSMNVGLMMFNNSNASRDGGYVRVAVEALDSYQKTLLLTTLTTIMGNFNTETTGTSIQYSAILFDAFKYFGGYSNPYYSTSLYPASGLTSPTYSSIPVFGTVAWGSNDADGSKPDARAYSVSHSGGNTIVSYNGIIGDSNNCGNNFIVFVGNGFPAKDDTSPDMSKVLSLLLDPAHSGNPAAVSQLPMPPYVTANATSDTDANACISTTTDCLNSTQLSASLPNLDVGKVKARLCNTSTNSTGALDCNYPISFSCQQSTCSNKQGFRVVASGMAVNAQWAAPATSDVRYADEFTRLLANADVSGEPSKQFVTTYTVDVFSTQPSAQQTQLMRSMAQYGKGDYYSASDSTQLKNAFTDILRKILAVNSVFASASLPVSATNRSQNENQVYIGLFRPDPDTQPRWFGNLKRYQITDFGGTIGLDMGDQYSARAINPNTGFIDDCAVSFWTQDLGQYWQTIPTSPNAPSLGTTCSKVVNGTQVTVGSYSDWPDGPSVEKGATAQMVRSGDAPTYSGANTPTYSPAGRTLYTLSGSNLTALTASTSTDVKYAMGYDLNNERPGTTSPSGTDAFQDVRPSVHGDVIHSRPLPVNYSLNSTPDIVIYYGGNDGFFRAVDAATGKEKWAFMAPEFITRQTSATTTTTSGTTTTTTTSSVSALSRLRTDSPLVQYPNLSYTDGVAKAPKDYFFDGSSSLYQTANNGTIWLFTSQRRGGRMVYAFDVTNKNAPAFKWRYGCPNLSDDNNCVGTGAANMAQTWSLPSAVRIKLTDGSVQLAVVFGGGYEGGYDSTGTALCDDKDNSDPGCASSTKGRGVFVVDANTGALLHKFPTTGPVAADIAFVDTNYDGFVDAAYAADTRGNLYRINFSNASGASLVTAATDLTGATITQIAYTNGGGTTAGRKFLFPPSVVPVGSKVYVALGSGDREHPLITNYPYTTPVDNRFYVLLDDLAATVPTGGYNLDSTDVMYSYSAMDNSTSCVSSRSPLVPGSSKKGWYVDLGAQTSTTTDPHRGEQVVTSALIAGGNVIFSTNTPTPAGDNQCSNALGLARGYSLGLVNACGYSSTFVGGGLPPSPVLATVPYTDTAGNERVGTVCIGCPRPGDQLSSPIGGSQVKPTIQKRRNKAYWYSTTEN